MKKLSDVPGYVFRSLLSALFHRKSEPENLSEEERYFKALLKKTTHELFDVQALSLDNIHHIHSESSTAGEEYLVLQTDVRPRNCMHLRIDVKFPADIKGYDRFGTLIKKLKFNLVSPKDHPEVQYGYNPKKYSVINGSVSTSLQGYPIYELVNGSRTTEKVICLRNSEQWLGYVSRESLNNNYTASQSVTEDQMGTAP